VIQEVLKSYKVIESVACKWEKQKKSDEINGHLVWVLDELLDNPELVFTVTHTLVGGGGITRHALVDLASAIVARYIGNACNGRTIPAFRGFFVKRNVTTSTCGCARRLE